MESKLILDVNSEQIAIALTEDGRLVEFSKESREASFSVGNIYLAKVKKLMPGLNAAFVDVGYEKDAFLHYLDLGLHFFHLWYIIPPLQISYSRPHNRTWLSLVERLLWEQDAAGSNPVVRTIQPKVALGGGLWLHMFI